MKAALLTWV